MGESDLSSEVNAVTVLPAPSAVSGSRTIDDVSLGWTNNDDSSDGSISVEVSTDGGSNFTALTSGMVVSTTSYTESDAYHGSQRIYRVVRTTPDTSSTSSTTGTFYIPSDPSEEANATTILPSATNVSATTNSNNNVDLSWTNGDDSTDGGVDAERSSDGGSTWTDVTTGLAVTTESYTDTSVSVGTTYDYRIKRNTDHATTTGGPTTTKTFLPITIGGDNVFELTIDGEPITGLTIDGTTVF